MSTQVEPVSGGNVLSTSIFTNIPDATSVDPAVVNNVDLPKSGFISSIINKFTNNKKYLYVGIAVILLAGAVYYYYFKHKKLILKKTEIDTPEEIPQKKEYTVLDTKGKPLIVNDSEESNQILLLKKQLQVIQQQQVQQQREQLLKQQVTQSNHSNQSNQSSKPNKQVLQHPNDESSVMTDNDSDEINAKIASIQAKESNNISKQNLTNSEIEEINKKLEQMKQ